MKRLICILLIILLFSGCAQTPVETTPATTPATTVGATMDEDTTYLPETLLGKSPQQLFAIFGNNYKEEVPEGDPPYFYFEGISPYWFCGSVEDEMIHHIKGQEKGSAILPGLSVGSSLEELEAWAETSDRTYRPADAWYETAGVQYGWAFVMGEGYNYSLYIKDGIIFSFECWMETE